MHLLRVTKIPQTYFKNMILKELVNLFFLQSKNSKKINIYKSALLTTLNLITPIYASPVSFIIIIRYL